MMPETADQPRASPEPTEGRVEWLGVRDEFRNWVIRAHDPESSADQRLVQMPTIGGSLPFSTFSSIAALITIAR